MCLERQHVKNVLVKEEIELLRIYDFITILFSSRDDWLLSSLHRQGFIMAVRILVLQLDKTVIRNIKKILAVFILQN